MSIIIFVFPVSLLQSAGAGVYGAMKAADPEAVWLMQGWMFEVRRFPTKMHSLDARILLNFWSGKRTHVVNVRSSAVMRLREVPKKFF